MLTIDNDNVIPAINSRTVDGFTFALYDWSYFSGWLKWVLPFGVVQIPTFRKCTPLLNSLKFRHIPRDQPTVLSFVTLGFWFYSLSQFFTVREFCLFTKKSRVLLVASKNRWIFLRQKTTFSLWRYCKILRILIISIKYKIKKYLIFKIV